jgi:hypothetical protein
VKLLIKLSQRGIYYCKTVNYTEEVDTSVTTQVPLTTFSYVEGTPIVQVQLTIAGL